MKFIFFFSQIYEYYNEHINRNLKNIYDVEGIKIDDLENKSYHTFYGGVSIKIEILVEKIKENMGDHILFSDATIFINSKNTNQLAMYFDSFKHNDLTFANNGDGYYNIGLIFLNCNEKTLRFFIDVLVCFSI